MSVIEIQPSRLLAILVTAVHVAAAFSLLSGAIPMWASGAVVAALAVSLAIFFLRRGGCCRIGLHDDGRLVFEPGAAGEFEAELLPSTVVTGRALWLVWRAVSGGKRGMLLLQPDQMAARQWREMQVWARLRAPAGAREARD